LSHEHDVAIDNLVPLSVHQRSIHRRWSPSMNEETYERESRFREEQIIGILKEQEAGAKAVAHYEYEKGFNIARRTRA